ncbi:DUF3016 domain-containing protein [Rubrivivax albus]|nr:DUF3016 domain-containing protein [Rubrivivax albus]
MSILARSSRCLSAAGLAALCAVGLPAHATGAAEVHYAQPERFTDAGFGSVERERTQARLTAEIERLASRLPDGQRLSVTFTDVDLAGEIDHFSPHGLRVMGLLPDAPRLSLRFELTQGGEVVARGEEQLRDLSYLVRRSGLDHRAALPYESRLLTEWFEQRFAAAR